MKTTLGKRNEEGGRMETIGKRKKGGWTVNERVEKGGMEECSVQYIICKYNVLVDERKDDNTIFCLACI